MAATFSGNTLSGIELNIPSFQQGPTPLLIVVRTRTAATQDQGRIFCGDEDVNDTYSLFAARTNPGGPLGYRLVSARTSGGPHRMAVLSPSAFDNTYRTIAIQRAATPDGSHFAYVDGAVAAINEDNNTGTYTTAINSTNPTIGNSGIGDSTPYDGAIDYLYIWQNTLASAAVVSALSGGTHPSMLGLSTPTLGVELFGSIKIFGDASLAAVGIDGYEPGAGSYQLLPIGPLLRPVTIATQIEAALAGTPPAFTASGFLIAEAPATLSATVEGLTGSLAATVGYPAVLVGTPPTFTASGSLITEATATLAATIEGLTGSITATVGYPATFTANPPSFTASGSLIAEAPATLAATVEGLTASIAATVGYPATLTGTAPTFTASASLLAEAPATLAATVEGLTGSLAATVGGVIAATLTGTAPTFTATGSLIAEAPVTLTGTAPIFAASGPLIVEAPATLSATVEGLTGSGAMIVPGLVTAITAIDPERSTLGQFDFIENPTIQDLELTANPFLG